MIITNYNEQYKQKIIDMILHIQNEEAKISLSLEEQPDLLDIDKHYIKGGGEFLVAVEADSVIGTIAFMNYGNNNAVLKKFFVRSDFRCQKVGLALYNELLSRLNEKGFKRVVLDTPSVATKSHKFYEKAGFRRISKDELPFHYEYPDRHSFLYFIEI